MMIVITDGESHDSSQLPRVVANSKMDNVTMYAIAVSPSLSVHVHVPPPPPQRSTKPKRSVRRFWVITTGEGSTPKPS